MRPEGVGDSGRESSLCRSLTLRKEGQEGDMTHQVLCGQRLGGHPSSAHSDRGKGKLYAGAERERHPYLEYLTARIS